MIEEWQGQTSQRFTGGKLTNNMIQPNEVTVARLLGDTSTGVGPIKGRKHYEQQVSEVAKDWVPCFKKVEDPIKAKNTASGLKRIDFAPKDSKPRAQMRHLDQPPSKTGPDLPSHMRMVVDEQNIRVQDKETLEYNFEVTHLGRKTRVSTLDQMRNQLPQLSGGDKSYKKPEHSTDFYLAGGLVPGSSNVYRLRHQSRNATSSDFATVQSYEALSKFYIDPPRMKWSERLKQERLAEEQTDVNGLIEWEKTVLKESNPHYVDPDLTDEET